MINTIKRLKADYFCHSTALIFILFFCISTSFAQKPKFKVIAFYTGKDEIDREEEAFLAHQAQKEANGDKGNWFYRTFVAWLF